MSAQSVHSEIGGVAERDASGLSRIYLDARIDSAATIERLYEVTAALAVAATPDQICEIITTQAIGGLGAVASAIMLLNDDRTFLEIAASIGYSSEQIDVWGRFPIDSNIPLADVTRTGRELFIETVDELGARYPDLRRMIRNEFRGSWAAIPLIVNGTTIGAMGLSFIGPRSFAGEERSFITTLTHQCALALERSRLFEAERAARALAEAAQRRLELLSVASTVLASSFDYESTLQRIAELAVPLIADWCAIDVLNEAQALRQVAVAHASSDASDLMEAIRAYPQRPDNEAGALAVIRSGEALLIEQVTDARLKEYAVDPEHLALLHRLDPRSYMIVPLKAHGHTHGVMTLLVSGSGRSFTAEDLTLAEDLAYRIALSVENAKLYRQAERSRSEAEFANSAKDQFLAVLSHELRTPLTPVLASVQLMQMSDDLPESCATLLDVVHRNIDLEARLIDDLLDLTRITRGKITMNMSIIDMHEIIDDTLGICQGEINSKGIRIEQDLRATRPHVCGDRARLQQILWNLLKNAVKFTPEGGTVRIRSTTLAEGTLVVEIEDSGIGIEERLLSRIFDAFEQGESTISRQFGGLGLGLTISKILTDMHGGMLGAASDGPDHGATFSLRLGSVDAQDRHESPVTEERNDPTRSLRILLVEDHGDSATVMKMLLQRDGHLVEVTGTVRGALDLLARESFDLLISDIGLPDGTGWDLMEKLSPLTGMKAIALTGFGMEDDVRRSRAVGFMEHLTKPVNYSELRRVIERLRDS